LFVKFYKFDDQSNADSDKTDVSGELAILPNVPIFNELVTIEVESSC